MGAITKEKRRRPIRMNMAPQKASVAPSRHSRGPRRRGQSSAGVVALWVVLVAGVTGRVSTAGRPRDVHVSSNQLCLYQISHKHTQRHVSEGGTTMKCSQLNSRLSHTFTGMRK